MTLHAELRALAPQREPELHRLASAGIGVPGTSTLRSTMRSRAGDVAAAGRWCGTTSRRSSPRAATSTAEHWLGRFQQSEIAEHATLALTAAGCALLRGQGQMAAHWTAAAAAADGRARRCSPAWRRPRGALAGAPLSMRDAGRRRHAAGRALSRLIDGTARHLEGDPAVAAKALENGARSAAVSAPRLHALCLAQLAVLAVDQDDWEPAAVPATRARAQVDRHGLGDHAAMALVFAVSALVRARRGRVEAAESDL